LEGAVMKDYQKRVIEELVQLEIKLHRLTSYIHDEIASIDPKAIGSMNRQRQAMIDYATALRERISLF
jgi:hypothetical protein